MFVGPTPSSKPAIAPSRNPPSRVVYIQNLVRPFTINQLRELLQRTGRLTENGFWIDNIKSKCLAMVRNFNASLVMVLLSLKWIGHVIRMNEEVFVKCVCGEQN